MKLRITLLVILVIISFSHIDARHRQKGGKSLHRSKRTIGDIINWKLNLIQSILGGIGGIFGGGKSPRPSYGPRPQRPSYGSRPQKPSYGNQRPSRPRPRPRPQPRPSSYNSRPQRPAGRPQFGPSNAIKMLKAPNLATAAPPVSFTSWKNKDDSIRRLISHRTSLEVERDDDQVFDFKWSVFFVNIVIRVNSLSHTHYPYLHTQNQFILMVRGKKKQQHFISFPADKTSGIMLDVV